MATKTFEQANPSEWENHLFGLTEERWVKFYNKNFLVTGAGTGYGRCIACGLAAAGAKVFLVGRREEKLRESINEISFYGVNTDKCYPISTDLTVYRDLEKLSSQVKTKVSCLHGLINNAALPEKSLTGKPLQENTIEDWKRMIDTNLTAPFLLTRLVFSMLKDSGSAKAIFVTSEAGWASTPGFGMYNVTKAAINSLCHSMASEYESSYPWLDIQINALIPGEARTEMNRGSNINPYSIVSMTLILLSHPKGGPNGKFFHRDGRSLSFGYTQTYDKSLI